MLPIWQAGFTGLAVALAFIPLCFVASIVDEEYQTDIYVWGGFLFCLPILLFLPIGLAAVGSILTASFTPTHGPFDLLRLTSLTDKDILHAFVLTVFYRVGLLLTLIPIGFILGLVIFYREDALLFGTLIFTGVCLLNPMAALVGIYMGLRYPYVDTASSLATTGIFLYMMVMSALFWIVIALYPKHTPFASWQPTTITCIILPIVISGGIYALALRLIRQPDLGN